MRKLLILLLVGGMLVMPVSAVEFTAPPAPDSAQDLMPAQTETFGEGLWKVFKSAVAAIQPDIAQAAGICLSLIAVALLVSLLGQLPGSSAKIVEFAGAIAIGTLLLRQTDTLIRLGSDTVTQLSEYGKLLLPVMTAALAAQGGGTSSAALYAGTAAFDTVLSAAVSNLLLPLVYMYLALSVAGSALGEDMLKKLRELIKGFTTWCLKTVLYIFTGYMGITGVVSGTTDAAALKATKLTISGMVPVVGGILSDASEAVIVGAGVVKNAAGVYGMLAICAIWITPFLRIGIQYLMLKLTAALCGMFGGKQITGLIQDFSGAMGLLLGMTGTVCVLLLVSMVCFMKGVG